MRHRPPSAGGLARHENPRPPLSSLGFELLQQGPGLKLPARRAEVVRDFSTPFSFFAKRCPALHGAIEGV